MNIDNDDDDNKVHCPDCEALIPKINMELHRVRACTMATLNRNGADRRRRTTNGPSIIMNLTTTTSITVDDGSPSQRPRKTRRRGNSDDVVMMDEEDDDNNYESNNEIIDLINETTHSNSVVRRVNDTITASNATRMVDLTTGVHGVNMDVINNVSNNARMVDLTNTGVDNENNADDDNEDDRKLPAQENNNTNTTATTTNNNIDNRNDSQWSCPQCTLLNLITESICDACQYRNPNITTSQQFHSPDRLNRRQESQSSSSSSSSSASPLGYIGSGAIIGAAVGAAGNWMQGRSPLNGAFRGGTTGAVGGAFLHEVLQNNNDNNNNESSRTSAAAGVNDAGYNHTIESITSTRHPQQASSRNNNYTDVANARSSVAMGIAGYPSMNATNVDLNTATDRPTRQRQQPRASYRSVRTVDSNGNEITVISGGNSTTRVARRSSNPGDNYASRVSNLNVDSRNRSRTSDPMMDLMLHHQLQMNGSIQDNLIRQHLHRHYNPDQLRHARANSNNNDIDTMNYEQLLNAFGDGTENLGANEGDIRQLPTHILKDDPLKGPSALPEDARQCLICLEDFAKGERRSILPCLHGFHTNCSTKWLRTNGSCPICKHRITQST
jgi:hypothetical protein